jgi:hypothetical protein
VALGADCILIGRGLEVAFLEGTVSVMAIGTLHQALFHLVMERHVELGLDVVVALEAQGRLSNFEQLLFILACMNAVTADATHIGLGVSGAVKVGVLSRVATQTTGIHFLRRSLGRIEYLGDVSATIDMGLARTMTRLARHSTLAVLQRQLAMRIICKALGNFFMARGACFRAHEFR